MLFVFLLHGSEFTHYDNFSHWARITASLIRNDALPTFQDGTIYFTAYPVGSAAFIYYICQILGCSEEWIQMWAQAILMLGMSVALFSFVGSRLHGFIAFASILVLLCGNISFVDLLVDTLLPMSACSGAAFCAFYRKELRQKQWYFAPYLIFLTSVKNSGLLFALLLVAYAGFFLWKEQGKAATNTLVSIALPPLLTTVLWKRHVSQVFETGTTSKHAMTFSNYLRTFSQKSFGDIRQILVAFAKKVLLGQASNWLLLVGMLLIAFLLYRRRQIKSNSAAPSLLLLAVVGYCAYVVGLLGMYLFSMPGEEALNLAGFGRYHQSILQFSWGLLLLALIEVLPPEGGKMLFRHFLATALALALMVVSIEPHFSYFTRQSLDGTSRQRMDTLIQEYSIEPGKRYLVLVDRDSPAAGILHYMTGYLLCSTDYSICTLDSAEMQILDDYDYLILYDQTTETEAFFVTIGGIAGEAVVKLA